jgi:hypothetical protein
MNVIEKSVTNTLINELEKIKLDFMPHFNAGNNLINHKLLYCNKWNENKYDYLVNLLKNESPYLKETFEKYTLLQINFINAPPDCNDQLFHIDYLGDSISFFIPLVELSDLNGTEYLFFYNNENYMNYFPLMLEMSEKYFSKPEAREYMDSKGFIYGSDYEFRCANSDKYALIEMPNYVYHRGQKNKTGHNRIMLNILLSINNAYDYPTDEIITDSEVDEAQRYDYILKKRGNVILSDTKK